MENSGRGGFSEGGNMNSFSESSDKDSKKDSDKSEKSKSSDKKESSAVFGVKQESAKASSELGNLFGEKKGEADKIVAETPLLGGIVEREEAAELDDESLPYESTIANEVSVSDSEPDLELPNDSVEIVQDDEMLTDDESRYATQAIIDDRQSEVDSELSEALSGSPEEVEAAASAALFDAVQEHIDNSEDAEQAIDDAAEETLAEINQMAQEIPQIEIETDDGSDEATQPISAQPQIIVPPPILHAQDAENTEQPPRSASQANSQRAWMAGPRIPWPNQNVAPSPASSGAERGSTHARDALIGGVVGYVMGKRRGRHKTEAELEPVQQKLETEVKDLQDKLREKESEIRLAAREQLAPAEASQEQSHHAAAQLAPELDPAIMETETKSEVQTEQLEQPETKLKPYQPELITTPEKKVDWKIAPFIEVLTMAATIEIHDGHQRRSIRELYERGAISKEEARRLVVEYARGAPAETLRPIIEPAELNPEYARQHESEDARQPSAESPEHNTATDAQTLFAPTTQNSADHQSTMDNETTPAEIFPATNHSPHQQLQQHNLKVFVVVGVAIGIFIAISVLLWLK